MSRWTGERCGYWCPTAKEPCGRMAGHVGGKGGGHRAASIVADEARRARVRQDRRLRTWNEALRAGGFAIEVRNGYRRLVRL